MSAQSAGEGARATWFRLLAGSSYAKAVATLSTGQFLAAAIPMLAAPIQGRLYVPSDYGVLATYMAIANVMSVLSTLQLAQGVTTERS
jgi:O-antigen/teichoic acid export membrane protein